MDLNPVETMLGRWSEGPGPLHRKLSDALRQAIELGHLPAGTRLPAERDLASRLAVSRSTVVTAYDALRGEGLLESRQGSGTRVRTPARASRIVHSNLPINPVYRSLLTHDRDGVISLATAALPAHWRVTEAIRATAAEDTDALVAHTGYMPAGLPALRTAVADMLTSEGLRTTPDQIVVTTGAQQAVNLAGTLFVRPGDEVVVESPSFAGVLDIFRTRGVRLAAVPVDDDGVDVQAVRDIVTTRRPRALYVMPSFHNPTGADMSEHRRRELAALANETGITLIEDNALEQLPLEPTRRPPVAAFADDDAPVVSASSLDKAAWGGLRIGWLRGPAGLVSRIAELKGMTDLGSPLFEQAVAARLVPHVDELRRDNRLRLSERLDLVVALLGEHLPDWEWRRPRGGPSLWIRLPSGTATAFAQMALRHGVEVIPGDVMATADQHIDRFRLPYTAEPHVLAELVQRLAAAWREYAPREVHTGTARAVVV
jgi:DNA-binding transcriptional MocR family regulator